jgi:hypothetical protein
MERNRLYNRDRPRLLVAIEVAGLPLRMPLTAVWRHDLDLLPPEAAPVCGREGRHADPLITAA